MAVATRSCARDVLHRGPMPVCTQVASVRNCSAWEVWVRCEHVTIATRREPAVELARRLLGQPAFEIAWGGRRRLVSTAASFRGRAASVLGVPAYRREARTFRGLMAARSAFIQQALVSVKDGLSNWLPSQVGDLVPFDALIGTPGPYQAVLVRLTCPRTGRFMAVGKVSVSIDSCARARIRNEVEAMRDVAVREIVPEILGEGVVEGHPFFVMRFVHGRAIGGRKSDLRIAATALEYQNDGQRSVPAEDHPFVRDLTKAVPQFPVDELPAELKVVRMHGDFAPWNVLATEGRRLVLIDWESSRAEGLPYADLAYFLLANERYLRRRPPDAAVRVAARAMGTFFNVSERTAEVLVGLGAGALLTDPHSGLGGRKRSDWYWRDVVSRICC